MREIGFGRKIPGQEFSSTDSKMELRCSKFPKWVSKWKPCETVFTRPTCERRDGGRGKHEMAQLAVK